MRDGVGKRDAWSLERSLRPHISGRIPERERPRTPERERPAEPMHYRRIRGVRGQRQVDAHVAGDVALLRGALQDGGEIQSLDVERARKREVRRAQVRHELAANQPGFRFHVQIHRQTVGGPVRGHDQDRVQLVAGKCRDDPADLRQGERPVHGELDHRRTKITFDGAAKVEGALSGLHHHLFQIQIVVAHGDDAGRALNDEFRIRAAKAELAQPDGEMHGLVLE